jgi:amidohydrolase
MSEFLNRAPGCFVLVGACDPAGPLNSPHHSPTFDFDEAALPTGAALLAATALRYLETSAPAASDAV